MKTAPGTSGLIMNEPLLWEKGKKGRKGMSIPVADVPLAAPEATTACSACSSGTRTSPRATAW